MTVTTPSGRVAAPSSGARAATRRRRRLLLWAVVLVAALGLALSTTWSDPGVVVWQADASRPLEREWASLSTDEDCAVTTQRGQTSGRVDVVDDADSPSPSGRAYRIEVREADRCYGSRAEVGQGNPEKTWPAQEPGRLFREGDEYWISFAHRLGDDYPIDTRSWSIVHQWKQTASLGGEGGYPVLSLSAAQGTYRIWGPGFSEQDERNPPDGRNGSWERRFGHDAPLDRWHLFTMRVVWSPDPDVGRVELYGDLADGRGWRELVPRQRVATMKVDDEDGDGEAIPVHARMGIYRSESIDGDADVEYAGYTVATGRGAAEAGAFRPALRP